MNTMTETTTTAPTSSTANRMGRNPFEKKATPTSKARVLKTETRGTNESISNWTFSQLVRFMTVTVPVGSLAIGLDLLRERMARH